MTHFNPNNFLLMSARQHPLRSIAALLLLLLSTATAQGQSSFTVDEAVKYALTNSATTKNAELDEKIARERVREITAIGFPKINGSLSLSNNYIIQKVIIPDGAAFGGPPGQPLALEFQPQYGGQAVLSVNQLIFDGSYIVGLQAARTYKELAYRASDISRVEVIENVKKAYYGVLVNQEALKTFEANIARADSALTELRSYVNSGFAEKIELDRLTVQRNNLLSERDKVQRAMELTLALLKFQMNYPANQDLQLTSKLADAIVTSELLNTTPADPFKRPEFKLLQTQREAAKLELKNVRAGYLPSIGAQLSRGALAGANQFSQVSDPNGSWFAFGAIGLSINMPIFDSFDKRFRAQQKKLSLMKIDNSITEFRSLVALQTSSAESNLRNAYQSVEIQKQNMALSEEVLRISRIKYQEGVGSNYEVVSAETDSRLAQSNYYAALYELLIAKIELEKAKGELLK
jgi:outer membrane protein TolC